MTVPVSNKRTDLVSLGGANIWIDGVDVGHVKGDVVFACERQYVGFKPSNELGNVKMFRISEQFKLTCQATELKLTNLRLALGVTTSLTSSYVPTGLSGSLSFTVTPATQKWDSLAFGGSTTIDEFAVKLEHTRPNGNKVVLCLYKAQCVSNLDLAFKESDIIEQTLEFNAIADSRRAVGDRVGIIFEQVR